MEIIQIDAAILGDLHNQINALKKQIKKHDFEKAYNRICELLKDDFTKARILRSATIDLVAENEQLRERIKYLVAEIEGDTHGDN